MKIIETIFDSCYLIEPEQREDARGTMSVFFNRDEVAGVLKGFEISEQRIYKMPKKNTFFGIHFQKPGKAKGKLISVVQGRALDFIVDLRAGSPTFKQYKSFELNADCPRLVYLPAGFGHGFFTLEDNTIQAFAIDELAGGGASGIINYKDPEINLQLPVDDSEIIISDYDKNAGMEIGK